MARELAKELESLGLADIVIDEFATVTAVKKGNVSGAPRIGFITHIDTVDVGLSPDIHPQILTFTGEDLCLNKENDIWLRVDEHPEILAYPNEEIIFSDGTSVLGADNKSAVTVVMTVLENLTAEHQHGDIVVAFVPDEEIGLNGAKALDLKRFDVDFAWTIDCCELGEIVYENFNAAAAEIRFTGVTAHPMSAKGVLVNPLLMAMDYINHFDRQQTPECTEGREGYIWFQGMQAGQNEATFFCGSCAVIRRSALEEIGGFAVETVTEDAHTALKMQRLGWKSAFLDIPLAAGLATERLVLHVIQRTRWARE
jgi:tripeptide aminopeptidase